MALVCEAEAAKRRSLRVRPLVATVADGAVFALIAIYSGSPESHAEYAAIGTPLLLSLAPALLIIYAASTAMQTVLRRRGISFFETAQALVAALLTVWTILAFWPGHGALVLGVFCLLASAAGDVVVFAWFDRIHAQRNYHVYAIGSVALLLAGCFLALPSGWAALCFALSALVLVILGARTAHSTLLFHGMALLVSAAFASSLFAFVANAMVGLSPAAPRWMVSIVGVSSILCYADMPCSTPDPWWSKALRALAATVAVVATTAFLAWILMRALAVGIPLGAQHLAVLRTLACCAAALSVAWCGSRWQRDELVWLAWAVLAFTAFKRPFEDLRHGHLGFTAASIFLYAVALLLIPRLLHKGSETDNGSPS